MDNEPDKTAVVDAPNAAPENDPDGDALAQLIAFANSLLDTGRLLIAAALVKGPANRMELAETTGLPHRELLRQLGILESFGLVKLQGPVMPGQPDQYSPYELDKAVFRAARQAMGKYRGVKPRPTDAQELILDTFMPGGKLTVMPMKEKQVLTVLDEIARKFDEEKQYTEKEVNVILEEVNEDYCTLRRYLVDYGYLSRSKGIYTKLGIMREEL